MTAKKFDARAALYTFARTLFEPPPDLSVWEWCEQNIRLSERESPTMPGRYSTAMTPYVREPLQCFADKSVGDLTLCWGTQLAKTLTMMCGVCYRLENDPSNALWVIPNEKPFGTWFSDNRWLPMLDNCLPLAAQKPPPSSHRWKKLEQQFDKVTMSFVGSNSAANLAGRPIGLLVMDETDKFPQQAKNQREPGAVENAEERTKTVTFGLHVKTSTPTLMSGEIWQQFRQGDQRYYFVPCWFCNQMISLNWTQVRWWTQNEEEAMTDGEWDYSKVRANAHYQCQECGKAILDHHKGMMLEQGIWRPTNLDREGKIKSEPGRRSYHLNSIYAPWEKCNFGNLAVSWLAKKKTPSGRQKFINSTLAEPWDSDKAYDVELVKSSNYKPRPGVDGRTPVMGVDVQGEGTYFWVIVRSFAPNGESWLLHEEKVMSVEGLEEIQQRFKVDPNFVVLDMADMPNKVARIIVARRWRGMWGSTKKMFPWVFDGSPPRKLNRIFSTPQTRDPNLGTRFQGRGEPARFVYFSKNGMLDALDDFRQMRPRMWHIYDGVSKEYHLHMNAAEKRVKRNKHTGAPDFFWYVKEEDHLLTAEYMALCCAMVGDIIKDASPELRGTVEAVEPVALPGMVG